MKQFSFVWYIFMLLLLYTNVAYTAKLRLYCGPSIGNYTETDLDNSLPLLDSGCFNKNLETVIYAFGFTSGPDDDTTEIIIQSYLMLENHNVFMINWEKEAASPNKILNVVTYPASAVPNAKKVGKTCGQSLNKMSDRTLNLKTTYLIGHSLGAHMVGYCARELQTYNKNVSRITGLDPAGPLFEGLLNLDGLDSSCAEFVVALHTNPGALGTTEQVGTVDIWFSCNKGYQPKCKDEFPINQRDSCSHNLVCYYYAEAILNPTAFQARKSESCSQWTSENIMTDIIYVGETTDRGAQGNYYLKCNAESPYDQGAEGSMAT